MRFRGSKSVFAAGNCTKFDSGMQLQTRPCLLHATVEPLHVWRCQGAASGVGSAFRRGNFDYSGSAALGIVAAAHHSQRGHGSLRIFNWLKRGGCAGSEARVAAVLVVSEPVECEPGLPGIAGIAGIAGAGSDCTPQESKRYAS